MARLVILFMACLLAVLISENLDAGDQDRDVAVGAVGTAASAAKVDTSTLTGKIMCGYQGWFNCPTDGADLGWTHWARHNGPEMGPGSATVDLWPDVSQYDADELYSTKFRLANGQPAKVFSSHNRKTVRRHFKWMQESGIDKS